MDHIKHLLPEIVFISYLRIFQNLNRRYSGKMLINSNDIHDEITQNYSVANCFVWA
jgi:hypothetical protein